MIVVHCIVLEIRPEGLPDGLRVGGGRGGGMRERKDSKMILRRSNWPQGTAVP